MLSAINTKLLIAILAALTVIGGAVAYQRNHSEKSAAAAAILLQQQKDAEDQKERDATFRKRVENERKQRNTSAAHEGKTWKSYLP